MMEIKPCKFCHRDDLYLKYDERFPNKYYEGQQLFAPHEDVPHFMCCPENPFVKERAMKAMQEKYSGKKSSTLMDKDIPMTPKIQQFEESPLSKVERLEKEILEIRSMLKVMMAQLEWIQQALVGASPHTKRDDYRD